MKKRILSFLLSIITVLSAIAPTAFAAYAADFETQMRNAGYPESYIPALIALHEQHPNWSFKPLITNENFSTAVDNERKPHNQQLIQKWSGNDGKGYYCTCENDYKNGKYVPREGSDWISASKTAVQYYMDPRNFLNEQYIFQFLSNEYDSSHTQSGVEAILKGTWMYDSIITYKDAGGKTVTYKDSNGNTVKYSKAIMNAAKDSGLSAYYIASKIKQEVGGANPTAGGARGTGNSDGDYKGIYNYYNINATTGYSAGLKWAAATPSKKWLSYGGCNMRKGPSQSTDILIYLEDGTELTYIDTTATQSDGYKWVHVSATVKGKTYTGYIREDLVVKPYNRPWTNPYLSIYNGAQWIADNYKTQNTGYLQKFNVNPASSNRHSHEYMANVQGAASEGNSVYTAYKNNGMLDENLTFLIPVYMNMPVGNLKIPEGISLSNESAGVKVSWKSVSGAEQYTVFRKTASTGWTPLGNTLHTNYTDKTAKSNVKYYYSVCCTSADGKSYTSGYDSTGKSITYIAAPVISSISGDNSGTIIKWNKPAGAVNFKVYRKTGSSSWQALGTTTSTSFTDKTAVKGTKYSYTVRCISKDGKTNISGYTSGESFTLAAAPKITSIANADGVSLKWNNTSGSKKFKVYRKTASTSWKAIKDVSKTSYTDTSAKSGTTYTYTVRCLTDDGKTFTSGYDTTGKSIKYFAVPKITSVSSENSGVSVKWGKVGGAQYYKVYRKTASTGWAALGTTASTSFTDKTVKSGTSYTYTVRCCDKNGNVTGDFDKTGASIKYAAAPKITSIANADGVSLKWNNTSGSKHFRVYRKTASTGWEAVKDVSKTSYTDTSAKSGTTYTYTVRCLSDDGKILISGYDTTGKSIKYFAVPKITSVSSENSGVSVKWGKVGGAQYYKVYRKTASTGWAALGTTASTSFTDKTVKSGTSYTYTVRCCDKNGNVTGDFDKTGASIKYAAAPKITSIANAADGISIKWNNTSGSKHFRVYRKTASTGWKAVKDVSKTSYTDTSAKSGTTYTYTVRCLSDDGKILISGYDTAGKSMKYVAPPGINSVKAGSEGIEILWDKVTGAEKYRIYRKTENSGWTSIGLTSSTNFTDKQVTKGISYTYTVRCTDKNGTYISDYDRVGKSAAALSSPSRKNEMVQVAEKEIGKNKGGKKFWSWAGYSSRVPWCNLFVTWCADQLGYYPSKVPLYQKPKDTAKWYQDKGLFKNTSYIPKAGDLIIFDNTWGDGSPTHIGIVEKYQDGRVYCIEGNNGDDVKKKSYLHNDPEIYGYATPDYGHN